jgi:hypothetical protein
LFVQEKPAEERPLGQAYKGFVIRSKSATGKRKREQSATTAEELRRKPLKTASLDRRRSRPR